MRTWRARGLLCHLDECGEVRLDLFIACGHSRLSLLLHLCVGLLYLIVLLQRLTHTHKWTHTRMKAAICPCVSWVSHLGSLVRAEGHRLGQELVEETLGTYTGREGHPVTDTVSKCWPSLPPRGCLSRMLSTVWRMPTVPHALPTVCTRGRKHKGTPHAYGLQVPCASLTGWTNLFGEVDLG